MKKTDDFTNLFVNLLLEQRKRLEGVPTKVEGFSTVGEVLSSEKYYQMKKEEYEKYNG